MRSIWKGAISFGMVTIPVKLYSAIEQRDVRFRLLHKDDNAPIEEKRFCTADGKEVAWEDLVRGYEVAKGEYVILDPEEIDAAKPESSTTIDIGDFVEAAEIDPVYFEKSYFLEPGEGGGKAFSLLRAALEETERVAVARVTIRTRERLATLRAYDGTLVLETMFWPDEIRSTRILELPEGEEGRVREKELQMARTLVENLADRFRPESYTDTYRAALEKLIEQKSRGETRNAKRRKPEPKVIDLMEALRASVAQSGAKGSTSRPTRKAGTAKRAPEKKKAPARRRRTAA
jgi:DNA end-binding protein Ku